MADTWITPETRGDTPPNKLSVRKDSEHYQPYAMLHTGVSLDGTQLSRAIAYDVDEGWVETYMVDEEKKEWIIDEATGDLKVRRLTGKVEAFWVSK